MKMEPSEVSGRILLKLAKVASMYVTRIYWKSPWSSSPGKITMQHVGLGLTWESFETHPGFLVRPPDTPWNTIRSEKLSNYIDQTPTALSRPSLTKSIRQFHPMACRHQTMGPKKWLANFFACSKLLFKSSLVVFLSREVWKTTEALDRHESRQYPKIPSCNS
jgi:hypothetical protein